MGILAGGVESREFAEQWLMRLKRWDTVRQTLLFPRLREIISDHQPSSVFEIGCGEGSATAMLIPAVSNDCSITATDINQTLLTECKKKFESRVTIASLDIRNPPSIGQQFDVILCCSVLMLVDDATLRRAAAWMRAHLKDSGIALVSIVHPSWTLAANTALAQEQLSKTITFPAGWDGVSLSLYYRNTAWYREKLSEPQFYVKTEETITLPIDAERLGARFSGFDTKPVYWILMLTPSCT
ncbi:class I SAM-dependent methyltransferase [Amycolatopsis sp. NPDC048633]|uniref:class I SAM-dependent methyltransferase n=1 Tax=Amycolatopsis sp. NPDC048633 TaxID=3157095 RepID=UPI0033D79293